MPASSYLHPRISPDARKLAIEIEGSNHDCYIYDFISGLQWSSRGSQKRHKNVMVSSELGWTYYLDLAGNVTKAVYPTGRTVLSLPGSRIFD